MHDVGNIWFVSFCALGVAWGIEIRPIKKREGGSALAFDGHNLNNKYNNQPIVGIHHGGIFTRLSDHGGTFGGEIIPSKSGDRIIKKLT
jgi:hypothetical protein